MRTIAALLASVAVAFGQYETEIDMNRWCPNKTSAEINAVIDQVRTDGLVPAGIGSPVTFNFYNGAYFITNDVSFSSNITINVSADADFVISSGVVMTFSNNYLNAGSSEIFDSTSAGTATGTVRTIYRWPEWGNASSFNIGSGVVGSGGTTVFADQGNTYDGGTLQAMSAMSATNMSLNGEAIDAWGDIADIVSTNTRFAGYPSIALTTNMITTDHYAGGGSAAIVNSTFTNSFDSVTNTYTATGVIDGTGYFGTYTFDLGASYQGFVTVDMEVTPDASVEGSVSVFATEDKPTYGSTSFVQQGGLRVSTYGSPAPAGYSFGTSGAARRVSVVEPFSGRYVNICVYDDDSAGAGHSYKFSVIKAYGVTR